MNDLRVCFHFSPSRSLGCPLVAGAGQGAKADERAGQRRAGGRASERARTRPNQIEMIIINKRAELLTLPVHLSVRMIHFSRSVCAIRRPKRAARRASPSSEQRARSFSAYSPLSGRAGTALLPSQPLRRSSQSIGWQRASKRAATSQREWSQSDGRTNNGQLTGRQIQFRSFSRLQRQTPKRQRSQDCCVMK